MEDLTVRGGRLTGDSQGGAGIRFDSSGMLTLNRVQVADNTTTGTAAAGAGIQIPSGDLELVDSLVTGNQTTGEFASGGGIWAGGGDLSIVRSTFTNNSTIGNYASAGALYALDGVTTITDSTLSGNSTSGNRAGGGAIAMISAEATVRGSTISGNSTSGATSPGGGFRALLSPTQLINSTVSGNQTGSSSAGGGLFADRGDLSIQHSTITGNTASGSGGGIGVPSNSLMSLTIDHSIVAANTDDGIAPDFLGVGVLLSPQAVRFSLIGDGTGTTLSESQNQNPTTGNFVGSSAGGGIIDPTLGPLANNGGLTLTHLPLTASPVIDTGDAAFDANTFSPPLVNDQRGDGFSRINAGQIDIGAVEFESITEAQLIWQDPADITFGTPLSSTQLNATANVPGAFSYIPPAGVFLSGGLNQTLTVTFVPTSPNLSPVSATVKINVNKADPIIVWNEPTDIVTGTPLSEVQLNASTDVDGTFRYEPDLGSVLGVGEDQVLTATFTPINQNNYNIVQRTVSIDVIAPHDFGDAPGQYPVLLSQDGARHLPGALFLGNEVDADLDGQPSEAADADGDDEDGLTFVADAVAVAGQSTLASWLVDASQAGKLDAWIDFNQDGDWDDPGEQVHQSVDVSDGANLLAYVVPDGSIAGTTFARLRLSSAGGLAATGAAPDGEVEDYQMTIQDGSNQPAASLRLVDPSAEISVLSGEFVVRQGGVESFRVPIANLGSIAILGGDANETVTIDLLGGFSTPINGLQLDGANGGNTLVVKGDGESLDLTGAAVQVSGIRWLDLSDDDANQVVIDVAAVARLSPMVNVLEIVGGQGDQITVADASDWRMTEPIVVAGSFVLTAQHIGGGGETIQAKLPHAWQNFLRPSDVNDDGQVSASDALRIINELSRRVFSDPETQQLDDPIGVDAWPDVYFDQSGDDLVTAVDALRVINELARQSRSNPSGEELQMEGDWTQVLAVPSNVVPRNQPAAENSQRQPDSDIDQSGPTVKLADAVTSPPSATDGFASQDGVLQEVALLDVHETVVDQLFSDFDQFDDLMP